MPARKRTSQEKDHISMLSVHFFQIHTIPSQIHPQKLLFFNIWKLKEELDGYNAQCNASVQHHSGKKRPQCGVFVNAFCCRAFCDECKDTLLSWTPRKCATPRRLRFRKGLRIDGSNLKHTRNMMVAVVAEIMEKHCKFITCSSMLVDLLGVCIWV